MTNAIKYRREFHKYPEPGWTEIRTSARIVEILQEIGVPEILIGEDVIDVPFMETHSNVIDLSEETRMANCERAIREGAREDIVKATKGYPGVIGLIDTGKPGPTYAFRFDIDCLPYDEFCEPGYRPYDEGYISTHPGSVHACGHDGHTSLGLGLAEVIMGDLDSYKGRIKLIFQPAEEVYFGAESIVAKGHLDDVDEVMIVHVALSAENEPLTSHQLCCGVFDFMSCSQLDVTFHGRGAHPCGAAQEGKNALLAAASAALNLHAIAMHEKGLGRVNVGFIRGGDVTNTICPECTIGLEYRGQYREITEYMKRRVFDVLDGSARQYDLTYTYVDYGEFPAALSSKELMAAVQEEASHIPWFEKIYFEGNVGGSDDAAAFINRVQDNGGVGTYIGLGCDTTGPVHNPKFDFDEDCLEPCIELLARMLKR